MRVKNRRIFSARNNLFVLLTVFIPIVLFAQEPLATGKQGMVATAHPLATAAGLEMLQQGGNAIDATVAAAFAIGVVEPDGSGLGGGGAMVIWLNDKQESVWINYYHQASSEIAKINYTTKDRHTGKSVIIPGTAEGLLTALERYGKLSRQTVMEPAIRYARDGFAIDATLAGLLLDNTEIVTKDSASSSIFTDDGFPRMEGDLLVESSLAQTLQLIAERGRSGFYEGTVAADIVKRINREGGAMTMNDLKKYHARIGVPVKGKYRGFDVISAGAPQSGISIIEALNILENENLNSKGLYTQSGETLHLMAETFRRIYADRYAFIEDPAFANVPVQGMISKEFATDRFQDINLYRADPRKYVDTQAGNPFKYNQAVSKKKQSIETNRNVEWGDDVDDENASYDENEEELFDHWGTRRKSKSQPEKTTPVRDTVNVDNDTFKEYDGHTTHISIIDKDGNAVSLTQTLGTFFGSGITVDGILLNCGMSNFASTAAVNAVAPNKQPRSSISPTIILKNGQPYMIVGSPGANRIMTTVVELIVNGIDFGMSAQEINDAPRFYCQKFDDYLHLEGGISEEAANSVIRKGHNVKRYGNWDLFFGGAQLIVVDQDAHLYYGSADKRRGGVARGY